MLETPVQNRTYAALDWHATLTERAGYILAHFIEATAADKRAWCPDTQGENSTRSCFQQASECVQVNRSTAALFRGEAPPSDKIEITDIETCKRELLASSKELADAIRAQDDSLFSKVFQMPWGPMTGAVMLEITFANMHYHAGQVNLIQMLGGDADFHVSPGFGDFVPEELKK